MRIASRGVNDFVPAKWTVPQNPVTGGMGDLVPGRFAVPQNPVGMGDFTPTAAMYEFPDNTVLSAAKINGLAGIGNLGCSGGCGGGCGMSGLTDTLKSWDTTIEAKVASMFGVSATNAKYITYGGLALAGFMILKSFGGKR